MSEYIDVKEEIIKVVKNKGLSETAFGMNISESKLSDYINGNCTEDKIYAKVLNYILDLKSYTMYGSYNGFFYRIVDEKGAQYCMITIDRHFNCHELYMSPSDWEPGPLSPFVPKLELIKVGYKVCESQCITYIQKSERELLEMIQKKIFQLKKRWTKFYV